MGVRAKFNITLAFSEGIGGSYIQLRDGSLEVDGGIVLEASRVDRRPDLWRLTLMPFGNGHVTITLPGGRDCSIWGAICAAGGKKLSNRLELTVPGPSTPTPAHGPANAPATGAPAVTGTIQVGQPLTADISGIDDPDGLDNISFEYRWLAGDSDIPGATGSSYTLADADEGKAIRVRVSFTDDAGNEESLTSAATAEVEAELPINSPARGSPSITGTAQVGQTLTASVSGIADEDGLPNATFAFQWIRTDGSTDTEIAGATGASYTLVNDDKGKTVKVRVSFTDGAGHEEALTGAATATIAPPPLTASLHTDDTPESHDGSADFTFELRFSEEFSLGYVTLRDHAFTTNGGAIVNANRVSPPQPALADHRAAGLRRRCEHHARHRHKL